MKMLQEIHEALAGRPAVFGSGLREAARKAGAREYVLNQDLSPLRQLISQPTN